MKCALVLGGLLALAAPAPAGELIPELVPADAKWLAHLDLEALQQSVLFSTMNERSEEFRQGLEEMRAELGVEPLGLIRSISVYSSSTEPETGVALLVVDEQATSLLEKLQQQEGYQMNRIGDLPMHSWSDQDGEEGERVHAYVHQFEGVSNRLVFVSNQPSEVIGAVDVMEGRRQSITDLGEPPLRARPRPGSFFYVETSEDIPGLGELGQMSAVAEMARGLRFDVGEAGGVMSADLVVTTQDAGEAIKLTSVLQGVTALAGLIGQDEGGRELAQLATALRFTANGNEVGVQFQFDSRRLVDLLEHLED